MSNEAKWAFWCWLYSCTHWQWIYDDKLIPLQKAMTVSFTLGGKE